MQLRFRDSVPGADASGMSQERQTQGARKRVDQLEALRGEIELRRFVRDDRGRIGIRGKTRAERSYQGEYKFHEIHHFLLLDRSISFLERSKNVKPVVHPVNRLRHH